MDETRKCLLALPVPLDVVVGAPREGGLPDARGVYAWWGHQNVLPGIVGPPHPTADRFQLLYLGIAPDAEDGSGRTMRQRLLRDHMRKTRRSTLRRVLAAFLWEQERWTPTVAAGGRPILDRASELSLTEWMRCRLAMTWATHDRPWELEPGLIAVLGPPLNVEHNKSHPLYPLVRDARARWTAAARGLEIPPANAR